MVDSETSRSLPIKTRGNFLSIVTDFLGRPAEEFIQVRCDRRDDGDEDIAATWHRWYAARAHQSKLCRRQQRLEKRLLTMMNGFPQVELTVPGRPGPVFARTAEDIDSLLAGSNLDEARALAKAKLLAARAAWDKADAAIGYTAAIAAEDKAYARAMDLAEDLWRSKAPTVDSVVAKLHCLIEMEDPGFALKETPWRQLRAILLDLRCLDQRSVEESVVAAIA